MANVLSADGGEVPFTLDLPTGWKWNDGQADKVVSFSVTIFLAVEVTEAFGFRGEEKDTPAEAAKKRLAELPDEAARNEFVTDGKITIRDQRVVKVGDYDAVWTATAFQAADQSLPTSLDTNCVLQVGGKVYALKGSHIDIRRDRTAKDFDESQAAFLQIGQSFRLAEASKASQ